ncbi:unnamed protein product [Protopolystoma xenopodis]|uniref:Uncharacterized protein n=1 Tax=Protopolystoma xenopodis TaxID=117903 RepID=A0A448WXF8_9PLAT|nr:unnamed protein product [Protopolystoma xenopodis]
MSPSSTKSSRKMRHWIRLQITHHTTSPTTHPPHFVSSICQWHKQANRSILLLVTTSPTSDNRPSSSLVPRPPTGAS